MKLILGLVVVSVILNASWKDLSLEERRDWVVRHFGKFEAERLERMNLLEDDWLFEGRQPESLNVRIVGRWPFGPTFEVTGDTLRNLVFQGSGSGVRILDISNMPNVNELSRIAAPYAGLIRGLAIKDTILVVLQGADGFSVYGITNAANPNELARIFIGQWLNDCVIQDSLLYIAGDDSLRIYNLKDPRNPVFVGGCAVAALGIYVQGSYAYLVYQNYLRIYDISNPANPVLVGTWPGGVDCRTVWVSDTVAYIGTYNDGLQIINVANVSSPFKITDYPCGDTRGLFMLESPIKFLYLPDHDDLRILDVSNPANPQLVDSIRTPGWAWDVWVTKEAGSGSYIFLGDHYEGLGIYDSNQPSNLQWLYQYGEADAAKYLAVSGNYAYLADHNGGLKIFDITDPSMIKEVGQWDTSIVNGTVTVDGVAIRGTIAFTRGWFGGVGGATLTSFDVSDPSNPNLLDTVKIKATDEANVVLSDTIAYVAATWVQAVDVSNPTQLETLGSCRAANYVSWGLFILDSLLYVAQVDSGLTICNFADPTAPYRLSSYVPGYAFWDVFVVDTLAYIAGGGTGLHILSITDPLSIYEINNHSVSGSACAVFVKDTLAYVGADYMTVLNVSNIHNIQTVGYYGVSSSYRGPLYVDSNFIYSANYSSGFTIFEYSSGPGVTEIASSKPKQSLRFQNPVTKQVLSIKGITSPLKVSIYSITGQKISYQEIRPERSSVSFNNLPSGVYFLLFERSGWREVKKVILFIKERR